MKIYEIYFSPTGGTKKVADILAEELQGDVVSIDLTDYKSEFQDVILDPSDIAIIAAPSYAGRVPAIAIDRFSKIKGNGSRAVLVCVYGNRAYEDTLIELEDTANEAGFHTIAGVSAVAEHSIARQFATGRPDKDDQEQLIAFAEKIQSKISEGSTTEPTIPGNHPYKKRGGVGMVPKATKDCVQCGICAEKCPVQAIDTKDPKKVDSKVCISCMRCVSICPHSARKLNKIMLAGAGIMLKKVCSERKIGELFI